jgi:hypothetical protein
VRTGRSCYLPTGDKADVTLPKAADDTVTIRADFLRILILGGSAECGLDGVGVQLVGGWIDGKLDLAFGTARGLTQMDSCHFTDAPSFYRAHLKQLDLDNSHLPGLIAQGMQVEGSVYLRQITATETVAVNAARIGGQLACEGAALDGGKDSRGTALPALHAQGVEVGQHLFLRRITATGTVDVNGARVGGQLDCEGATLDGGKGLALNAHRLHVAHGLIFRKLKQVTGRIDMTAAHVGDLVDDIASWPLGEDDLILDGFTYDRLTGTAPTTFDARKDWLRAGSHWQGEFHPQPYTQLARVLRGMGHDRQARRVLFEMEKTLGEGQWGRDKARYRRLRDATAQEVRGDIGWHWLRMWLARLWDLTTRKLAGYGHLPQHAAYWLAGFVFAACCLYWLTWTLGGMVPDSDVVMVSDGWAKAMQEKAGAPAHYWVKSEPGTHYETFSSLAYAVDIVVPIIDLGQEAAWAATTATWLGRVAWAATWGFKLAGWLVTALGAAAVTGLIRRDRGE